MPVPVSVDVAVVCSGYTGLCAALELARGGRSVLALDAADVGWGCSSRNGGQISTSVKPGYDDLARRYGSDAAAGLLRERSEEHTSELQSLMRISYAVFCLKKKKQWQRLTVY